MNAIEIAAILVVLSALGGWFNHRFLGLPHAIGLLFMGLVGSLLMLAGQHLIPGFTIGSDLNAMVKSIDFYDTVMNGMLASLLFAAALHVDAKYLRSQRGPILLLATIGVLISTFIVGIGLYFVSGLVGAQIPLVWTLVFGALISPTDPVAVLSVLKTVQVPKNLEAKIAGESLFNDGVGIVSFTVMLTIALAASGIMPTVGHQIVDAQGVLNYYEVAQVFAYEVFGAIALGFAVGVLALWMIKQVDDASVEGLITLAVVLGTYGAAVELHLSGPIAVVIPGLIMGNWGANNAMSEKTKEHVFPFWTITDDILNSVLFLLIGLEVAAIDFTGFNWLVAFMAIPLVLLARYASVLFPVKLLRTFGHKFSDGSIRLMTWGGVRGGISVALALSLPETEYKNSILIVTYVVVVFSIFGQGLTIAPLARRLFKERALQD